MIENPRITYESSPDGIPMSLGPENGPITVESVVAASKRAQCGGVKMALEGTRQALAEAKKGNIPIYTNRKVVHNNLVMQELEAEKLVNFENDWSQVPKGSIALFSAHGVPPYFRDIAEERNLDIIDLTCQLVTLVHSEALRAEKEGKHVLYAGVEHHPETVGVMEEINPENFTLIETLEDARKVQLPNDRVAILLSQTTLSTAELQEIIDYFTNIPNVEIPSRRDICRATDNNQSAVKELIEKFRIEALLVQGTEGESHNTLELKKVGLSAGIPSVIVDSVDQIDRRWLTSGIRKVGFTAGASVEDKFTLPIFDYFRREGIEVNDLMIGQKREKQFPLPEADLEKLRRRVQFIHE